MPAWLIWVIAAGLLAGGEVMSLDFVLIMLAGGAAGGAIAAAVGAPVLAQVIVAVVVTFVLLGAVRPVARRHLLAHEANPMNAAALVGKQAIVMERVDADGGRVRLNGGEWSARSFDEGQVIEAGAKVKVMQIEGATAVVWDGP